MIFTKKFSIMLNKCIIFFIERKILVLKKLCDVECDGIIELINYLEKKKKYFIQMSKVCKRESAFKTNIGHKKLLLCIFLLMKNSNFDQIYLFTDVCDKTGLSI